MKKILICLILFISTSFSSILDVPSTYQKDKVKDYYGWLVDKNIVYLKANLEADSTKLFNDSNIKAILGNYILNDGGKLLNITNRIIEADILIELNLDLIKQDNLYVGMIDFKVTSLEKPSIPLRFTDFLANDINDLEMIIKNRIINMLENFYFELNYINKLK